jgi:hypothetical protein
LIDKKKEELSDMDTELKTLQTQMLEIMDTLNLKSFDFGEGVLEKRIRMSVKVPQGDGREAFFSYLKERGVFDYLISVNSQTLNSWYKDEHELAISRGESFFPPGLEMPTANLTVAIRKKK